MGDLWLVLSLLGFGVSAFFLGVTRADAKWIKRGQDNVLWVIERGYELEATSLPEDDKELMRAYLRGRQDGGWAAWKGLDDPMLYSHKMFPKEAPNE